MEHLDVLVVGAGLSGIGAGHFLQTRCPWATYAIAEARDTLGGTWDLFRYPGIRSDSDMFTLGYSFRPWDGEKAIADGDSILRYIRDTAADEGIDTHIRYGLRVVAADWSSEDARWRVTAERAGTDETVELTCGFLLSCTGYYRYDHGYQPSFPGSDRFEGTVVHPQAWPTDLDHQGKRVAIIGSGATAITLAPSLAASAHVTVVQRSPSYVLSLPARDPLADLLRRRLPDRWSGPLLRWIKALTSQTMYALSQRRPALVKRLLRRQLERQLPAGYDIDTHFTPTYDPWDQRLCLSPDGDLFDAIRAGTVDVVTDRIETFTEHGLRLASGTEVAADIIVTATGLELLFLGGMRLSVNGVEVDPATRLTYKGMMLQDVPNLAFAIGYTNASWTLRCDLTCDYIARLLNRMRQVGMRQCTPTEVSGTTAVGPLLGLRSGYVLRAADRLPRQGSAFPWQVHQSYLRDYRAMKLRSLDDPALVLSQAVRPSVRSVAETAPV
jgi:monooxygenase